MRKAIGYFTLGCMFFFSQLFVHPLFAQGFDIVYCNTQRTQIKTALGCIETTPGGFIQKIVEMSIGIAGGVALLMIILGAMQIQTSAGNPERVNQGKEIVEGAVTGLLLIIFAIFILRLIGVNLLGIPGFS
jgi:hypothetical protein